MIRPTPTTPAELLPIEYGTTLLDGIPVKYDSRVVIDRAFAGHPILVTSDADYLNLYHVFRRRNRRLPPQQQRHLVRQQIGPSRWRVFVVRSKDDAPALALERDYDPKRGRYKRYAGQLASGDRLIFHDKSQAIKARRAWRLYTPKAQRRNLRGSVRSLQSAKPTYVVEILARAR